jgi:hypothetical protein
MTGRGGKIQADEQKGGHAALAGRTGYYQVDVPRR